MIKLDGGTSVAGTDGRFGVLGWVALDPGASAVTHLAVEGRVTRNFGRLVPITLVRATTDGINLACTEKEFDALPDADEQHLVMTGRSGTWLMETENVPVGEVHVGAAEEIRATDGSTGRLLGLVIDDDYKLSSLNVEIGHLGRKHQVLVPIGLVRSIDSTGFDLTITKAQLAGL